MVKSDEILPAGQDMPPLSATLLLGIAMNLLPLRLVQRIADLISARLLQHYPDMLDRMESVGPGTVILEPTDFPYGVEIGLGLGRPRVSAYRRGGVTPKGDVLVRAPSDVLVALANGAEDGDALFFSRNLSISGNVELIIALRNAIDAADINFVSDVMLAAGPARTLVKPAVSWARRLSARVSADLTVLQAAILRPAHMAIASHEQMAAQLELRTQTIEREVSEMRRRAKRQ